MPESNVVVGLALIDLEHDREVVRVARRLGGPSGRLLLVHALPMQEMVVLDYVRLTPPEKLAEENAAKAEQLRHLAGTAPGPAEIEVALGSAVDVLVDRAKRAEFLVLGRTHRGLLDRLLGGAEDARIARRAPCPVVIVP